MTAALAPPPTAPPRPIASVPAVPSPARVAPPPRMTRTQFEEAAENTATRCEWLGVVGHTPNGEPLGAVAPVFGYNDDGTPAMPNAVHSDLLRNLTEPMFQLDRDQWRCDSQGIEIRSPTGRGRFPDLVLTREPAVWVPHPRNVRLVLTNPSVVVEVLSDSTAGTDLGEKRADYLACPTVTDYLVVAQDEPLVLHHRRGGSEPTRRGG